MKYVQLNSRGDVWAESIIFKKHRELISNGDESWVFWARGQHQQDSHMKKIAYFPEICLDVLQTRIDGKAGFHSKRITNRLLRIMDEIDPDVVHLHVLSNYWINYELLFTWLSKHSCKIKWTLHECSPFTGHCTYFSNVNCMQWKTGCAFKDSCPQLRAYPETFADDSSVRWCFEQKKRLISMIDSERVEIITPSNWLAGLVAESFFSNFPIRVVHNSINLDTFCPTTSSFRKQYGLTDKRIVLGVASRWSDRKGLDDFIKLRARLDDSFAIVLVGLDKKQICNLPQGMIGLPKTNSAKELAGIYSSANVFFNPTREDNYPTVNLEAEACGTDVVTYDVGGCRETISRYGSKAVSGFEEACTEICKLTGAKDD